MAGSSINWHKTSGMGIKARVYIPVATLRASGIDPGTLNPFQLTTLSSLLPQPSGQAKGKGGSVPITREDYQALRDTLQNLSGTAYGDANLMRWGTTDPHMISADMLDTRDAYNTFSPAQRATYDALTTKAQELSRLATLASKASDAIGPTTPAQRAEAKARYLQEKTVPLSAADQAMARSMTDSLTTKQVQALRDFADLRATMQSASGNYTIALRELMNVKAYDYILSQR
jgi:hypothetical protein